LLYRKGILLNYLNGNILERSMLKLETSVHIKDLS
jgi:hypothetical protein